MFNCQYKQRIFQLANKIIAILLKQYCQKTLLTFSMLINVKSKV